MNEKIPKLESIEGGVTKLNDSLKRNLQQLPENLDNLVDKDQLVQKRQELMSLSNDELLALLERDDRWINIEEGTKTMAVIDVVRGKITPAVKE